MERNSPVGLFDLVREPLPRVIERTESATGILAAAPVVLSRGKVKNRTTAVQYPLAIAGVVLAAPLSSVAKIAERYWFRGSNDGD